VTYEWDSEKNELNKQKHGISFEEAVKLFEIQAIWSLSSTILNTALLKTGLFQSVQSTGVSSLFVSTERDEGDVIRLISARFATASEIGLYEKTIKGE